MDESKSSKNKRIAKNTLLLYVRMLFVMLVTLFTSRVVLDSLGEDNFGIYNVVGGVVAFMAIITNPMQSVLNRFLSFELGTGDEEKLKKVFSASINIQLLLSLILFVFFEIVGVWFLYNKMNIPVDRLEAANWTLQCSLLTFILTINKLPFSAAIMAHEKMSIYAYISIFEVFCKLVIAYLIYISPFDKLVIYSTLLVVVSIIVYFIHLFYCRAQFKEISYSRHIDKPLLKEMLKFAGVSFLGDATAIINTQGVNILINIFFNVKLNAARGIAVQVDSATKQFVSNFTMAMYPQITKSYAANDRSYMFKLMSQGSKFSFFIMLLLSVPIILETDSILGIWLKEVPDQTSIFLKLIVLTTLFDSMQHTFSVGIDSTGNIKRYQLIMNSASIMIFILSWVLFSMGKPAYVTYIISAIVSLEILAIKLFELKRLMEFPVKEYLKNYLSKIFLSGLFAFAIPLVLQNFYEQSLSRFFVITVFSILWTLTVIWIIGLNKTERNFFKTKCLEIKSKFRI